MLLLLKRITYLINCQRHQFSILPLSWIWRQTRLRFVSLSIKTRFVSHFVFKCCLVRMMLYCRGSYVGKRSWCVNVTNKHCHVILSWTHLVSSHTVTATWGAEAFTVPHGVIILSSSVHLEPSWLFFMAIFRGRKPRWPYKEEHEYQRTIYVQNTVSLIQFCGIANVCVVAQ